MININLSNMVGDSSLSQSKSVSSDSLSTFKDFISEFKLEDDNSGTNTNNKEDVDESLILYNLIYTLYEKFNIAEKIDSLTDLENIKSSLNSKLNEVENTKNILDAIENLHTSSESNYSLELNNNDMKEIINNINYLINEGRNNSNKINESLNSLIDKIKNQIKDLDKSSQEDSMYENLDTVGILNQSKIDEYKSSKGTSNDIEYLENIVSADDNSYINSFVGINEFNTVYRNSTSNDIPQPVTEIRQEFITEDIIKSVKYMKNSDLEELNVKLNPRNLGEISIKLSKNKEHSNLLITVDDNNILDLVNKNIEDIKKHLNDTDINIKDIVINVKSENENLFSDNLNKEFNQDRRFNQNNSNKNKKNNNQIIEELHNSEHNKDDDNLNILI